MNILKKWYIARALKKSQSKVNDMSSILADELKQTNKSYKNLLKQAEQMQQIQVMRDRTKKLKSVIDDANTDDDDFEEEEEEEEEDDKEDQFLSNLIEKFATSALQKQIPATESVPAHLDPELINKLSPEQLEKIKGFLGA